MEAETKTDGAAPPPPAPPADAGTSGPADPPTGPEWGERKGLPPRRPTRTFSFEHMGASGTIQRYHATVGYYDGDATQPGELFLNGSQKSGSETDVTVSEAAIGVSLALQYGCPLTVIQSAVLRKSDNSPMTPVGHAVDLMVGVPLPIVTKKDLTE